MSHLFPNKANDTVSYIHAELVFVLQQVFEENGWSQRHIAQRLEVSQHRAQQLQSGIVSDNLSLNSLMKMLYKLDHRLAIKVML